MRRLRIGAATSGRFHVLDLARELHGLGHEVRFYSYVPKKRAMSFGLPAETHVSLMPDVAPWVAWHLAAPRVAPLVLERQLWRALNRATIRRLAPCDVFVCMSGIFLEAAAEAKARYGARINLHRGSQHILAQDEILARIPGAARPSALAIERELAGYELADSINIASEHVARSFERDPAAHAKLVLNPYGTDLDAFPMTPRPAVEADVTFVLAGLWCLQKGCDLLEAAVRRTPNVRVLHVGSIGDHPFPEGDGRFRHLDKVDQHALAGVYAQAHAFVLPSRQDGFGMVIPQALASGLPAICSDHTGGPELRYTPALDDRIVVVPTEDVDALAAAMATVRDRLRAGPAFAELTEADRETLTWAAYGRRYVEVLVDALDDGAAA